MPLKDQRTGVLEHQVSLLPYVDNSSGAVDASGNPINPTQAQVVLAALNAMPTGQDSVTSGASPNIGAVGGGTYVSSDPTLPYPAGGLELRGCINWQVTS